MPDIWKLLDITILSILLALSNLNLQLQMSYYHPHFEILKIVQFREEKQLAPG